MSAKDFHDAVDKYFETGEDDHLKILTELVKIERHSRNLDAMRNEVKRNDEAGKRRDSRIAARLAKYEALNAAERATSLT